MAQLVLLVAISPSEVSTIMQGKADTHNATMLPLNQYIIVVIIIVTSSVDASNTSREKMELDKQWDN